MVLDWILAGPIGRYVVLDVDEKIVRSVKMTREKPAFERSFTSLAKAFESYFETGNDDDLLGFDFDRSGLTPFRVTVMEALRHVPAGSTVTYGELAARAGKPGAARAVGSAMSRNPVPLLVPCHRVVSTTGLGGFTGGLNVKEKLLRLEGV
ncbi:MAG TPA: MGMT family protein [Methanocella sp.]|nr:MGMT family protein [Methanocella sp.]